VKRVLVPFVSADLRSHGLDRRRGPASALALAPGSMDLGLHVATDRLALAAAVAVEFL